MRKFTTRRAARLVAYTAAAIIAGSVMGCGSSNINKLYQFAIAP